MSLAATKFLISCNGGGESFTSDALKFLVALKYDSISMQIRLTPHSINNFVSIFPFLLYHRLITSFFSIFIRTKKTVVIVISIRTEIITLKYLIILIFMYLSLNLKLWYL
jgi:hypothetical protein